MSAPASPAAEAAAMTMAHLALLLSVCVVWGFTFIAAKFGVNEVPPLAFTMSRYVLIALCIAPFYARWRRGSMRHVFLIAMTFGAPHFALTYLGFANTSNLSTGIVVTQLAPPLTTLLSALWLRERVGWKRGLGVSLAFGGIAIFAVEPVYLDDLPGMAMVAGGMVLGAIGMILMRQVRGVGVMEMQGWIAIFSLPVMLLLTTTLETGQVAAFQAASSSMWIGLLWVAFFATIIGHGGMFYLLQRYPVSLVAPPTLLAPVFGVALSAAIFGDEVTLRFILGSGVALLGVFIVIMREAKRKAPSTD